MGKLSFGKVLDCICLTSGSTSCSCFCTSVVESQDDEFEKTSLIPCDRGQKMRLKDVISGKQTLGFQLKPKMVVLRVSMHCIGCARKVEKHVSKLEGVTSCRVDLENRMVVAFGDIIPYEVLESVSKIKNSELWNPPS